MVVKILPSLNTARLVRNFLTYSQLQITFIKGSPLEYYDESPKDIVILIINICYGYSLTMYRRRPTKCVKGLRRLSTLRHTAIRHRSVMSSSRARSATTVPYCGERWLLNFLCFILKGIPIFDLDLMANIYQSQHINTVGICVCTLNA